MWHRKRSQGTQHLLELPLTSSTPWSKHPSIGQPSLPSRNSMQSYQAYDLQNCVAVPSASGCRCRGHRLGFKEGVLVVIYLRFHWSVLITLTQLFVLSTLLLGTIGLPLTMYKIPGFSHIKIYISNQFFFYRQWRKKQLFSVWFLLF